MTVLPGAPASSSVEGLLVVNKPKGLTSHDVVQRLRGKLGLRRIGHAGTLDPMAEGVLVLLVGRSTKLVDAIHAHRKCYEAVITLGAQTRTADAWGETVRREPVPTLSDSDVDAALASCLGAQCQVPPAFSAVKVRGRPLYWWARRGTPQPAAARTITVASIERLRWQSPELAFRVECSTGTYVRVLAETIAQRLDTVGHLSALTRVSIGPWTLRDACTLAWLEQAGRAEVVRALQQLTLDHGHSDRP